MEISQPLLWLTLIYVLENMYPIAPLCIYFQYQILTNVLLLHLQMKKRIKKVFKSHPESNPLKLPVFTSYTFTTNMTK